MVGATSHHPRGRRSGAHHSRSGSHDRGDQQGRALRPVPHPPGRRPGGLQEEAGELAKALLNNDKAEVIDAIGDIVVVLTNLAHLEGVHIETCINTAYKVISKRKGRMLNGTFVKDER